MGLGCLRHQSWCWMFGHAESDFSDSAFASCASLAASLGRPVLWPMSAEPVPQESRSNVLAQVGLNRASAEQIGVVF